MHDSSSQSRRAEPLFVRGQRVRFGYTRKPADGTTSFLYKPNANSGYSRLKATTAAAAAREIEGLSVDLRRGLSVNKTLRIADGVARYSDAWKRMAADGRAKLSTFSDAYEPRLALLVETLGKQKISEVEPPAIGKLLDRLQDAGKAESTRRGYLTAWSSFFAWALEERLCVSNPCRALPKRRKPSGARKKEPNYVSRAMLDLVLDSAGDRYRPVLTVLAFAALRVGEAAALRWSHVDLEGRLLHISSSLRNGVFTAPKTAASAATVPLADEAYAALVAWKEWQREVDPALVEDDALVFSNADGSPFGRRENVRRHLAIAVKTANAKLPAGAKQIPALRPHDLRHSAAAILLANGKPLPWVSRMLRHANAGITGRIYAGFLPDTLDVASVNDGFGARAEVSVDVAA
jgi:integrase